MEKKKSILELSKEFSQEISQLKKLLKKYQIKLNYLAVPFTPWKQTFTSILNHFEPKDYDDLLESESESLISAITILNRVASVVKDYGYFTDFNKGELEKVFEMCGIGSEYYASIFDEVFNPEVKPVE